MYKRDRHPLSYCDYGPIEYILLSFTYWYHKKLDEVGRAPPNFRGPSEKVRPDRTSLVASSVYLEQTH